MKCDDDSLGLIAVCSFVVYKANRGGHLLESGGRLVCRTNKSPISRRSDSLSLSHTHYKTHITNSSHSIRPFSLLFAGCLNLLIESINIPKMFVRAWPMILDVGSP